MFSTLEDVKAPSVCEVDHPTAWVGHIDENLVFEGADLSGKRSQEYKKEFRLNGAIYIANVRSVFKNASLFTSKLQASVMSRERSVDIDESLDIRLCEALIEN